MARKKRNRSLERACDKAIIDTLKYRSVFKASLSYYQLGTFLISEKKFRPDLFETRVKSLLKAKKIKQYKNSYHLVRNKPLSWPLRAKYSQEHLSEVTFALELLKSIKWIKMLAVTGSVAAFNSKKKDDIDVFIITEKNRLWLTRFFVVLLLKTVGKYRTDASYNNKVCPNIYVDETGLTWPQEKRNIYVAHDILMMFPLINRDDMYFRFMKRNNWVFDHFANTQVTIPEKLPGGNKYSSEIIDFIELLSMSFQLWYMRRKKTTEITSKNFIHFLRKDHSEKVIKKYVSMTK